MALYNPFARYEMTQGWDEGSHRYPYNAVDYATPIGTRFGSPANGTYVRLPANLSRNDPTAAGNYGYLLLSNGDRIYFCHLRRHVASNGARVKAGDVLAETGNTGFVRPNPEVTGNPASGAHIHTYGRRASGVRFDWTRGASLTIPQPAGSSKYKRKKVTLAAVNLRKRPSTKTGDVIVTIPKGTAIRTGAGIAGWTMAKYGTKTGWIAAQYAVLSSKTVGIDTLTLRDAPRSMKKSKTNPTPAKPIRRLAKGTKVTVLAVHGKSSKAAYWKVRVRVGLRTYTGWVIGKHLK